MEEEAEVREGAEEGDDDGQVDVGGEASGAPNVREEEVERVYEEGNEAGEEEEVVPMGYDVAVRGKDLVPP